MIRMAQHAESREFQRYINNFVPKQKRVVKTRFFADTRNAKNKTSKKVKK